jgi:transcriptional regulator with XRE-family HTH domain
MDPSARCASNEEPHRRPQERAHRARQEGSEGAGISLKSASTAYRHEIAELKRIVARLEKRLDFIERQERKRVTKAPSPKIAEGARFPAKGLRSHREKLGLSAADYGRLVGISGQSIYLYEAGKSKPRSFEPLRRLAPSAQQEESLDLEQPELALLTCGSSRSQAPAALPPPRCSRRWWPTPDLAARDSHEALRLELEALSDAERRSSRHRPRSGSKSD